MRLWERYQGWEQALADPLKPPPTLETATDREFRQYATPQTPVETRAVSGVADPQDRIGILSELRLNVFGTPKRLDSDESFWKERRESMQTRAMPGRLESIYRRGGPPP